MTLSRRDLGSLAACLLAATGLTACSVTAAQVVSDAQEVASDAAEILATGLVPQPYSGIAQLVLVGFQGLLGVASNAIATAGTSTEAVVITSLTSAIKNLQGSIPTTSVAYTDAGIALTALQNFSESAVGTAEAQVQAAVGTALITYLEFAAPKTAAYGSAQSPVSALIYDARGHLAKMKV